MDTLNLIVKMSSTPFVGWLCLKPLKTYSTIWNDMRDVAEDLLYIDKNRLLSKERIEKYEVLKRRVYKHEWMMRTPWVKEKIKVLLSHISDVAAYGTIVRQIDKEDGQLIIEHDPKKELEKAFKFCP